MLLALIAYGGLLSAWRSANTPAPVPAVTAPAAADASAELEMTTRLSAVGNGPAVAPPIDPEHRRGPLLPLLAFLLPLASGLLLGSTLLLRHRVQLSHATDEEDTEREPVLVDLPPVEPPEQGLTEERHEREAQQNPPAEPARSEASRLSSERESEDEAEDELFFAATAATPEQHREDLLPDGDTEDQDDESVEGLRARLAARQEMIGSLEKLIRENREQWFRSEEKELDYKRRIALLEEELAAARELVEGQDAAVGDSDSPAKPQVLAR